MGLYAHITVSPDSGRYEPTTGAWRHIFSEYEGSSN